MSSGCANFVSFINICLKLIQDSDSHYRLYGAFAVLGLLVNYNKFEFQNPYQLRLEDFVNDATMKKVVNGIGPVFTLCRDSYVAIQDDQPEGWGLGSTLSYLGLGSLTGAKPTPVTLNEEEAKSAFSTLYVDPFAPT